MKGFRWPDGIVFLLFCTATLVFILWLGWPVKEDYGWRLYVLRTAALVPTYLVIVGYFVSRSWRLWVYRIYYRFRGPMCTITVQGTVRADPTLSDSALLARVSEAASEWDRAATPNVTLNNRSVIQGGNWTLTADAVRREDEFIQPVWDMDEWDDATGEGAGNTDSILDLEFGLIGYRGRLTRMEDVLDSEIRLLLEGLARKLAHSTPRPNSYTVKAHVSNTNPFLTFYLRDVPTESLRNFRLTLEDERPSNRVHVSVASNAIIVSAYTPSSLVDTTKRYLASPALAA